MNINLNQYTDVIWDWNGTLFNDVVLCAGIMNKLLLGESLPEISIDHYRNIFTFPVEEYYKVAGHTFRNRSFDELGKEFVVYYEQEKNNCKLYSKSLQILNFVKSQNINQHILSAYEQNSLELILTEFNLLNYFSNIIGLDNIYAGGKKQLGKKLNQQIQSNGKRQKVVLFGDTIHDYEVAADNGWDCILIADGHQSKEKLLTTNAIVLNNLSELENQMIKKGVDWEQ